MRLYLRVKGKVQGVGYRFFVVQSATQLSLTGWVRNCFNGDVECELQGEDEKIKDFLKRLENGHPWARVVQIQPQRIDEKIDEKGFEIRY